MARRAMRAPQPGQNAENWRQPVGALSSLQRVEFLDTPGKIPAGSDLTFRPAWVYNSGNFIPFESCDADKRARIFRVSENAAPAGRVLQAACPAAAPYHRGARGRTPAGPGPLPPETSGAPRCRRAIRVEPWS